MKETEPTSQTPEQLLYFLEAQRLALRARREKASRHRVGFLAAGILLIFALAGIALTVLTGMLSDLPRRGADQAEAALAEQH